MRKQWLFTLSVLPFGSYVFAKNGFLLVKEDGKLKALKDRNDDARQRSITGKLPGILLSGAAALGRFK